MLTTIGILGGTGDLGSALAYRLARNNERILVGSRKKEKAVDAVRKIVSEKKDENLNRRIFPAENEEVASNANVVIAAVPHIGALESIKSLAPHFVGDQLFISAIAPVEKIGNSFRNPFPTAVSEEIRTILPQSIKISTAFQTIPATELYRGAKLDADVLVCSENSATFSRAAAVISSIDGLRALHVGDLGVSWEIESLTSILLNIGMRNKMHSPTFKVLSF
jgi:NADPH-dependent F420 reductase